MCDFQCRCGKNRNLHCDRQHAEADKGGKYSEHHGIPQTHSDPEELSGAD